MFKKVLEAQKVSEVEQSIRDRSFELLERFNLLNFSKPNQ
jgi:hypothetical protein